MPLLMKDILSEGTFLVNSNKGRLRRTFDRSYLQKLVATGNQMLSTGMKIPAPFDHNKQAVPEINGGGSSSYLNAGYWTQFNLVEKDGKLVLQGIADIPGSDDDPNTPYYKAKNTAKEVSINIHDEYIDGLGRKWENAPLHVALVNYPVVPSQMSFSQVPDGSTIVNMSMLDSGDDTETLIGELRTALREAANLILPDSCTSATFLRDLLVAASQLRHSKPSHETIEPVPIYMSTGDTDMPLTQAQAQAIVDTKANNPATGKPFTLEDFGFKPVGSVDLSALQTQLKEKDETLAKAQLMIKAFANKIVEDTKNTIQRRINELVASKTITKEFADTQLLPKVAFEMSVVNGAIAEHPLEMVLSTLEANRPAPSAQPQTDPLGTLRIPPLDNNAPMDDAQLAEAMKEFEEFLV